MIRTISYTLLFIIGFILLDALGNWSHEQDLGYPEIVVVECDTDSDCEAKNPQLGGY